MKVADALTVIDDEKEVFYANKTITVSKLSIKHSLVQDIYKNIFDLPEDSKYYDVYTKLYNVTA